MVTVVSIQCRSISLLLWQYNNPFTSQTAIYAQGVGLGASKGKELGKYAEGYSGYVNMVQDAVSPESFSEESGSCNFCLFLGS